MNEPTDLDLRIGGLQQEFQNLIATVASRAATLASELTSCQAKLKAAETKLAELSKIGDAIVDNNKAMQAAKKPAKELEVDGRRTTP